MDLILIILVLILLFGGGFGYSRYGYRGGVGIGGILLIVLIVIFCSVVEGFKAAEVSTQRELVNHAAVIDDDLRHAFEIFVEHSDQRLRLRAMRHRGEAFDVGEQRGELTPLATQFEHGRAGGN